MSNDHNINSVSNYRDFTAEKVFLYVNRVMSDYPALREHAKINDHMMATVEQMCLQITSWCLAGRIPTREETETVEWPDGVWHTFKQQYMPEWFKTKFPVRMQRRVITTGTHIYFVCPHLVTDNRDLHLQFMATGRPEAAYFGRQR